MNKPTIYVPDKKYVYFDDEGNLLSVSNSNSDDGFYIEVPNSRVINLIKGTEQLYQYKVVFDISSQKYILQNKFDDTENNFDINKNIFLVPKDLKNADLIIKQNLKSNIWTIEINKSLVDGLQDKTSFIDKTLYFSIARNNDPHLLEKFIRIQVKDLLFSPFSFSVETDLELDSLTLSVYTIKQFRSYSHEVVNG